MGPSNSSCWSFMSAERRETWQTRTPVVSQLGVGGGGRTIDAIIVCVVVRFSHSTRVPLSQVWMRRKGLKHGRAIRFRGTDRAMEWNAMAAESTAKGV